MERIIGKIKSIIGSGGLAGVYKRSLEYSNSSLDQAPARIHDKVKRYKFSVICVSVHSTFKDAVKDVFILQK